MKQNPSTAYGGPPPLIGEAYLCRMTLGERVFFYMVHSYIVFLFLFKSVQCARLAVNVKLIARVIIPLVKLAFAPVAPA